MAEDFRLRCGDFILVNGSVRSERSVGWFREIHALFNEFLVSDGLNGAEVAVGKKIISRASGMVVVGRACAMPVGLNVRQHEGPTVDPTPGVGMILERLRIRVPGEFEKNHGFSGGQEMIQISIRADFATERVMRIDGGKAVEDETGPF
jgi:hypothetical protein